jgi:hypothetical protein
MCGGALFDWREEDNPFVEHAKFFPYFPYIRYVKGHDFIREQHPEYRTDID